MSREVAWHQVRSGAAGVMAEIMSVVEGHEHDYDLESACDAYKAAIRAALPQGVSLRGDVFVYDNTWAPEDTIFEIDEAISNIDLHEILGRFELERLTSARWAQLVVPRGVKMLDDFGRDHGTKWRPRVSADRLVMSRGTACVVGQLWLGGYREGMRALELESDQMWRYGFNCRLWALRPEGVFDADDYDALQAEWLRVLSLES